MEDEENVAFDVPTHRCLRCGGTSQIDLQTRSLAGTPLRLGTRECPVCTPYGPFGMVPEVVAIETSLKEQLGDRELVLRAKAEVGVDAAAWILEDKPIRCRSCNGTGSWVNPTRPKDKRPCFSCDGRGVRG